jgi:hypothetical protein
LNSFFAVTDFSFNFLKIFFKMGKAVRILTFTNEIEARLLESLLKERGIPHIIRSYHDSAYNGLWQTRSAWGCLEANEENREEIMSIFREMSKQDFSEEIQGV